jgi:hypothetical protein
MASLDGAQAWAQDRASVVLGSIVAAVSLGYCIELANGYYTPDALKYMGLAYMAPVAGLVLPATSPLQRLCARLIGPTLLASVVLQISMLSVFRPIIYGAAQGALTTWKLHGCLFAVALLGFCGPSSQVPRHWRILGMAMGACGMGIWVLMASPAPVTDVFVFAQDGGRGLFAGHNPFAMTFPDIYGDGVHYHPALVRDGRVLHGFPYPPINLLVGLGDFLTGDPRTTLIMAAAATTCLMASLSPTARALEATALFLLTPRCLFLLEQGFMEPLAITFLLATAWTSRYRPTWTFIFLGMLLVSKQTIPGLMAAAWLLPQCRASGRTLWTFIARSCAVGVAINLPFFLLNPERFWHSLVTTHILQLRPPVSLTLASYLRFAGHVDSVPLWVSLMLLGICSIMLICFAPRTSAGFCFGIGLNYMAFLSVNAQAFANYYHFIIAAMWASVACASLKAPQRIGATQSTYRHHLVVRRG